MKLEPVALVGGGAQVEMDTPMGLIYKVLFPSLSPFETPSSQEA